ncbi:MAG: site-2 protease family protein [Planctomycetia bacterium]|nr:site-2 protease family protein [Planctomycetia bacterium]
MGLCLIGFLDWLTLANCLAFVVGLAALGLVIFVHELGHFAVAKMCGVKCEKFYIGFDPPIRIGSIQLPSALWKRKWGETEYGIGIIPLGGYVKMLGQDDNPGKAAEAAAATQIATPAGPPKLDPRSYPAKSVPQRMAIISAGVTMNVIFAFICAFFGVLLGITYTPCIVDHPTPGDPAWRAGVQPRDIIREINGVRNPRFEDLQQEVVLAYGRDAIKLVIERPGQKDDIHLTLSPDNDSVGPKNIPRIGVVMENSISLSELQATAPGSPASALPKGQGFEPGDTLLEINGQKIADSVSYGSVLADNPDKPLDFVVERKDKAKPAAAPQKVSIRVPANPWRHLGLTMTMGPITAVQQGSPAANATAPKVSGGIQSGDRIVAIDGQKIDDPMTLPMSLRAKHGQQVKITVERGSQSPPTQIEFTTTLAEPKYWSELAFADMPVALVSLGVTYAVEGRVASIDPKGPAANQKISVGDEVLQAEVLPPEGPRSKEEKEEDGSILKEPLKFAADARNWPNLMFRIQDADPKVRVRLTLKHDSETRTADVTPVASSNFFFPSRGLLLAPNIQKLPVHSVGGAADFAWRETKGKLLTVYLFLRKLAMGRLSIMSVSGPGKIATVAVMSAKKGPGQLLLFLTLISANLAVVNFLPIPVLDGGHMLFLLLEGIFRRPVSERIVIPLTYAGLFLILSLVVLSVTMDVQWFASFF